MPENKQKISIGDYDTIMADRNIFNQIVYTPLSEALRLLDERQKDKKLMAKVKKLFKGDIPKILKNKKCGVIARQIATPNKENRYFISIVKENELEPVFFEYLDDKFTSNNKYKHSLGQLCIEKKNDCNGNDCVEKINIIDFNKYNGKKLKEIKTLQGESLVDFHRKLFDIYNLNGFYFHDESEWYKKNNIKSVEQAYLNFFLLFVSYGILFENFLFLDKIEKEFTRKVVLPALEKVINLTGIKPLIVPIDSLDLEVDNFWYYHLPIIKKLMKI
ncbi:MAG: hypothetical protein WCW65_00550 [Candidatus Paceibacterota bacterium]